MNTAYTKLVLSTFQEKEAEIHVMLTVKEAEMLVGVLNEAQCLLNFPDDGSEEFVREGIGQLEKCLKETQHESSQHSIRG